MRIHQIPGDGNCLFASCAFHLNIPASKLRQQVAQIIRKYPNLPISEMPLSKWIALSLNCKRFNHLAYADYIREDTVLGSGVELAIISIIYKRTIRVFNRDLEQIAEYFPEFRDEINLRFTGSPNSGHYDVLLE